MVQTVSVKHVRPQAVRALTKLSAPDCMHDCMREVYCSIVNVRYNIIHSSHNLIFYMTAGCLSLCREVQQDFTQDSSKRERISALSHAVLQCPFSDVLAACRLILCFGTAQVARLAMLSLLAVFKDILPGYRIRMPTEKELEIAVSKDVKQTRDYESLQLKLYQACMTT